MRKKTNSKKETKNKDLPLREHVLAQRAHEDGVLHEIGERTAQFFPPVDLCHCANIIQSSHTAIISTLDRQRFPHNQSINRIESRPKYFSCRIAAKISFSSAMLIPTPRSEHKNKHSEGAVRSLWAHTRAHARMPRHAMPCLVTLRPLAGMRELG